MKNNWISAKANFMGFSSPWLHPLLLLSVVILKKKFTILVQVPVSTQKLKRPYPQGIAIVCFDPSIGSLENWLKGLVFLELLQCWGINYRIAENFRGRWIRCWFRCWDNEKSLHGHVWQRIQTLQIFIKVTKQTDNLKVLQKNTSANPGEGTESELETCHIILSKTSGFQQ